MERTNKEALKEMIRAGRGILPAHKACERNVKRDLSG